MRVKRFVATIGEMTIMIEIRFWKTVRGGKLWLGLRADGNFRLTFKAWNRVRGYEKGILNGRNWIKLYYYRVPNHVRLRVYRVFNRLRSLTIVWFSVKSRYVWVIEKQLIDILEYTNRPWQIGLEEMCMCKEGLARGRSPVVESSRI